MRLRHQRTIALFAAAILTMLPGCLSLGGKTIYSAESPETSERLAALERRVGHLEQAVMGNPAPASVPGRPVEPPR